jgi:hypothetical protein
MQDRISITMLDDGIADVRLIRTDKMNALDGACGGGRPAQGDRGAARRRPVGRGARLLRRTRSLQPRRRA